MGCYSIILADIVESSTKWSFAKTPPLPSLTHHHQHYACRSVIRHGCTGWHGMHSTHSEQDPWGFLHYQWDAYWPSSCIQRQLHRASGQDALGRGLIASNWRMLRLSPAQVCKPNTHNVLLAVRFVCDLCPASHVKGRPSQFCWLFCYLMFVFGGDGWAGWQAVADTVLDSS